MSAVSETNTSTRTALIRLTSSVSSGNAIADNTATTITTGYSNIRLTGHDFLDIGTGDFTTTNYPGGHPLSLLDQADEVNELLGGRVYFTSTDKTVILELVIYLELNRQQVLQHLTQTHLTFQVYQNYNLVLLV